MPCLVQLLRVGFLKIVSSIKHERIELKTSAAGYEVGSAAGRDSVRKAVLPPGAARTAASRVAVQNGLHFIGNTSAIAAAVYKAARGGGGRRVAVEDGQQVVGVVAGGNARHPVSVHAHSVTKRQ